MMLSRFVAGRQFLPLLILAALGHADDGRAQSLPAAREIVDRHVAAIGGEAALRKHTSWKTLGRFSVPASGLSGEIEAYQEHGRMFARIDIPGIGELLRGYDGTVGWSMNPLEGPRILDGLELAQTREESARGATLRDTSVVTSLQTVEKTTMNGEDCWKVKVVWKSGRESFDCYSVESALLVATEGKTTTPMGEFQYTTDIHDYKQFGDLRIATRVVQHALGQEQVLTTESVEYGPVDASLFALPAAIKALVRPS
jgi:hypothetical protein